ncbi:MAG: polysaccharide biosynthesis C-terminal domain-containing protein [Woeseiaceae bacterium]|nr:polysaccharide biosynthesis C-terminal domain-containing protein [Woeseiaceae bacterium]
MTGSEKTARAVGLTFLRQVSAAVLQLLNIVVIANFAGASETGHFAVSVALAQVITLFMGLGAAPALVHFVAKQEVSERSAIALAIYLSLISIGLSLLALAGVGKWAPFLFPDTPSGLFSSLPIAIVGLAANANLLAILQGKQDFRAYNFGLLAPPLIAAPITLAVAVLFELSAVRAVWIWASSHLIATSLIVLNILGKNWLRDRSLENNRSVSVSTLLRFGWRAHVSNTTTFLIYRTDIFLVNWFMGATAVGLYTIAVHIAEKMWMISTSVTTVFFPRVSESSGRSESRQEVSGSVVVAAQAVAFSTFMVALVLSVLANVLVVLLFGSEFIEASPALRILLFGAAVFSIARVFAVAVTASGHPEIMMWVSLVIMTANVIANIALIPLFGISGAAISTAASYTVAAILNSLVFARIFEYSWWRLFDSRPLSRVCVALYRERRGFRRDG